MSYDGRNDKGKTPNQELLDGAKSIANGIDKLNDLAAIKDGVANKLNNKEGGSNESPSSNANNINSSNLNNKSSTNKFNGKSIPEKQSEKTNSGFKANNKTSYNSNITGNNMPKMKDSPLNKAKNKKKKKANPAQDGKKVSNVIEALKKAKKAAIKKKQTKLKIKIAIWLINGLISIFTTVFLFILANPALLAIIVGLQVLSQTGILGVIQEGLESYGETQMMIAEQQAAQAEYISNLFSSFLGINSADEDSEEDDMNPTDDAEEANKDNGFNPEDEYKDALLKGYDLCRSASKKAFKYAKRDAKAAAKSAGYSKYNIKIVPYVNRASEDVSIFVKYSDLYKTQESSPDAKDGVNYGTLIAVVDLLYLGDNKDVSNKYYEENSTDYDPKELENYLLNDKNKLRCLYRINIVPVSEDECTALIYPYDLASLFEMSSSITPETQYDESTTYADMVELRVRQMHDVLSTPETYEKLGLNNETPINNGIETATWADYDTNNISIESVSGNDNAEKIWNGLKQAGFTDIGAAAVLGNLEQEHHFQTSLSGDQGSGGIGQWREARLNRLIATAQSIGKSPSDIEAQVYYLVNQDFPGRMAGTYSPTGNSLYNEVKNATDLTLATDMVCAYYETPARYLTKEGWEKGRYHDKSRSDFLYNLDWSRFLPQSTVYYSYKGQSGYYYWLDLRQRRAYAQGRYNLYHE